MKLGKGSYKNFGSYKELEFDFSGQGLTLISGPTGSGKSTLMDMPTWCLFGITSKEGLSDEVKKWGQEDEATEGTQDVYTGQGRLLRVTRRRGGTGNDLSFVDFGPFSNESLTGNGARIRGKDMLETQAIIESALGCTTEQYLLGAYFTQFSKADSFFTAKAKERRDTLEKITDLSLPVRIAEGGARNIRNCKTDRESLMGQSERRQGRLEAVRSQSADTRRRADRWEVDHRQNMEMLISKSGTFERDKAKELALTQEKSEQFRLDKDVRLSIIDKNISELTKELAAAMSYGTDREDLYLALEEAKKERCPECGGPISGGEIEHLTKKLSEVDSKNAKACLLQSQIDNQVSLREHKENEQNHYLTVIDSLEKKENHYLQLLKDEEDKLNPYLEQALKLESEVKYLETDVRLMNTRLEELDAKITMFKRLQDLSLVLRGRLLEDAVKQLELNTNTILEAKFDAEIRAKYRLDEDKIIVELSKNGYLCSFKQLSGGQRCMLKVANWCALKTCVEAESGISFGNVFMDEPLNGLDGDTKLKAFSLLEELAQKHDSVFVIEHAEEFKEMFDNRYVTSLNDDNSTLRQVTCG